MFYTVMVRHPMNKWQALRTSRNVVDALKDVRAVKKTEALRAVIVKTDDKAGIKDAQDFCNRSIKSIPKVSLLDFSEAGIEAALLRTTS